MTSGFSMQAMTRSVPPHLGQVSIGPRSDRWRRTRFRRCIQVKGARGLSGFSWRGLRFGTTDSRCLQFGANTPWNRVRLSLGRGTSAARRAIKSSGCAKGLLEANDDLPTFVHREPFVGDGGSGDGAAELFELVALVGFAAGCGVHTVNVLGWTAQ